MRWEAAFGRHVLIGRETGVKSITERKTVDTTSNQISDWSGLAGQTVQVKYQGKTIRTGRVEIVSGDVGTLWLERTGVLERKLHSRAEGFGIVPLILGSK